jgi:signal transduction histidine kinase
MDTGKRREAFQLFDMSPLTNEFVDSYEPVFVDVGRQLSSSIIQGIVLNGDAVLFSQMLINLLENSIEHGQAGGNTWVRLQANRDGAILKIGDDGPSIAADEHEQVFERFFQGDRNRQKPGNGLALSLVKSICQLHHADIVVLRNQSGTVFDIYLPAV